MNIWTLLLSFVICWWNYSLRSLSITRAYHLSNSWTSLCKGRVDLRLVVVKLTPRWLIFENQDNLPEPYSFLRLRTPLTDKYSLRGHASNKSYLISQRENQGRRTGDRHVSAERGFLSKLGGNTCLHKKLVYEVIILLSVRILAYTN